MLVHSVRNVTKKDGSPAIVIEGIARRSDGKSANVQVWTDPVYLNAHPVNVGCQIRAYREGGYDIIQEPTEELVFGLSEIISRIL